MENQEKLLKAYNRGKELQDHSMHQIIWNEMIPDSYMQDEIKRLFFNCGYEGRPAPRWVRGWRYGHIPTSGMSTNYRDQEAEKGVSVMALENGDGIRDGVSALFIEAGNRPKVIVEGWLHYERGSDGEPLLVGAVEVNE